MFKNTYIFLGLLSVFGFVAIGHAREYHFVSIEKLVEQEIGRIIIPEIYRKLNIKITIRPMPGIRAQQHANSGKKDGEIMRIWTYGHETPNTIRVPTAYYDLETMAFFKKNKGVKIEGKEDLRKYRLVKVRGVKHTDNITDGMTNVYSIENTEIMMKFLQRERVDVALTNTVDGVHVLRRLGYSDIKRLDKPLATLALYHYIHEKNKELVPKVDAVIKAMMDNGELSELVKRAERQIIGNP